MTAMVHIIGLGTGTGLAPEATAALDGADFLVGGRRQLAMVEDRAPRAERWDLTGRLKDTVEAVANAAAVRSVVVLSSGDPLFHGIGGYLAGKLRARNVAVTVLPAPSSVSVAAARFGLSWKDAKVVSVHGKPPGDLVQQLRRYGKIAVLTDPENTPAVVGNWLKAAEVHEGTAHVAEALGTPEERCRTVSFRALVDLTDTHPLNVVFLVTPKQHLPAVPYVPDSEFDKKMPKKGLITKREVRVLSLAALRVGPGDVCWDLGAGSGAVSIDMAHCGAREVWAVEKNADGCEIIRGNVARFGAHQVHVVHAKAPDGIDALPDPDRVFIGGSGGRMTALVQLALQRLRPGGALVVNAVTIENIHEAIRTIRSVGAPFESIQVQVSRGKSILGRLTRFEALNPITVICAWPPGEEP